MDKEKDANLKAEKNSENEKSKNAENSKAGENLKKTSKKATASKKSVKTTPVKKPKIKPIIKDVFDKKTQEKSEKSKSINDNKTALKDNLKTVEQSEIIDKNIQNKKQDKNDYFKAERKSRVAQNRAKKLKKRKIILIVTACVIIVAVALGLIIPQLTRQKADDMDSATIINTSINMSISASSFPKNLVLPISTSDLIKDADGNCKLEKNKIYTVLSINDTICNSNLFDLRNDTRLMTVIEGNLKDIAMSDELSDVVTIDLNFGDFFDIDSFRKDAENYKNLNSNASPESDDLDYMVYKSIMGCKFDSFLVNDKLQSVIKGEDDNSKLFTISNRIFLTIEVNVGQHDAYKIMSAQKEALFDETNPDKKIKALVEFSTPWGQLTGTVRNGVSAVGNGLYRVVIDVEVPMNKDSAINIDTFVPKSAVTVNIHSGSASGLSVPVKAIFTEKGRDYVLVRKGKRNLQRVYVNTIISNGVSAIIEPGDDSEKNALIHEGAEIFFPKEKSLLPF